MSSVLIIEPNTLLGATYRRMLEHAGFQVGHVTGAQSGINAADKQTPDVVILELQLAGHSGLEFLHEFRSYTEWRDIPVIVHSVLHPSKLAFAQESLARELGVVRFLYKPHTPLEELLRQVRAQLIGI